MAKSVAAAILSWVCFSCGTGNGPLRGHCRKCGLSKDPRKGY
jgi:ribosomal protein L40E